MTILDRIIQYKREEEVPQRLQQVSLAEMQRRAAAVSFPLRSLKAALMNPARVALIAEVKKASPSKGLLRADFDALFFAAAYCENGAAALSVLTDAPFFQGSLHTLAQIRQAGFALPLLRKDFIVHPYQVYEARAAGADAVLLIASALQGDELAQYHALALELGLEVLVEVHDASELEQVLPVHACIIGINNRDLHTFQVDLHTCLSLRASVPPAVCCVAESGIHTAADMQRLKAAGINAALVGEALVTAADVKIKVKELVDGGQS